MPPLVLPQLVTALAVWASVVSLVQGSSLPPSQVVQCYVCGGSGDSFPGQPPPSPCTTEVLPALRACPSGNRGCLTTYNGHTMARSCEPSVVDECQVANQVVYCYCSGGKCNTHGLDYLKDKLTGAHTLSTHSPVDDEDHDDRLETGSGDFDNDSEGESGEVDSRSATERAKADATPRENDLFLTNSSEDAIASVTGTSTTPTAPAPSEASSFKGGMWGIVITLVAYVWLRL